jgi:hypothetical protein
MLGSLPAVPGGVALEGDFNGDGKLDLAGAGSLLLGNGDGTFVAAPSFAMSTSVRALSAGDVNDDGKLDLVVASSSLVSVFLGNGDGTFAAKVDYPAAAEAYSLALGDVDGDGDLDIVTANQQAGTVSVFLGQGNGTFAAKKDYPGGDSPRAVVLGDFDGDRQVDLAVFNVNTGSVNVLPGKGNGAFAAEINSTALSDADSPSASLIARDLNGDGKLDLLVATYLGSVSVLLGKGDGTFTATQESSGLQFLSSAVLMDIDGDRKLDLVLAVTSSGAVSTQLGKGDGTFAAPRYYPAPAQIAAAVVGDLNGDGRVDLAMSDQMSDRSEVTVLLGTGTGIFGTSLEYPVGGPVQAQALGDVNGDGKLDLVTSANGLSVMLGTGTGAFGASVAYPVGKAPNPSFGPAVALADVNGDHKLDAVTIDPGSNAVDVLLGGGDGTFGAVAAFPTGPSANALALGDVNGDGKLDVVTTRSVNYAVSEMDSAVSVLLGDGQGKFGPSVDYGTGVDTHGVALGDLDGDGKLDIVVANTGIDDYWSVGVLRGKGDGTFAKEVEFPSGVGPNSVALGDLNKDGKLDVVLANGTAGGTLSVLIGMGDGTLANPVDYRLGGDASDVTLGDVDGDGNLDLVAIGDGAVVLLGKGDGTFSAELAFAASPHTLSLGDLNGDGRLDLVVDAYSSSVAVLLNTTCQ